MTETSLNQRVSLARQGAVGIIRIDNPPINAGSHEVRQGLLAAIRAVDEDPALTGGVLIGAGRIFMAGSDLREFGAPLQEPQLPALITALEQSPKPYVAAIAGAALGGGYELTLGCDARVASAEAEIGLPECTLGVMPGAGGTQRLPRLIGREKAVELICAGARVRAPEAARLGMIDAVAKGDLLEAAVAVLDGLNGQKRRVIDRPVATDDPEAYAKARAGAVKKGRSRPHVIAAVDAVEYCGRVPAAEGLARERERFQELRLGREAFALRHLFFAERGVFRIPALEGVPPRPSDLLMVVGGGTMGAGIAATMLLAGRRVILLEATSEAAQAAEGRVNAILRRQAERRKLPPAELDAIAARFEATTARDRVAEVDVVIEAAFEDMDVKRDIFGDLGCRARPDAVLFTNTSYLSVGAIAQASGRPQDVAGLHFFSPAELMRLVEVVRHDAVAPDVLATGFALAKAAGKLPVLAGDAFGFIGNRIYAAYRRQVEFMLEEGALPEQIDRALERFGFAMGPFAVADMSGLDIAWRMRQATAASRDPQVRYVRIPDLLCEAGRLGRKTGAGYYSYPEGTKPQVDPVVTDLILSASADAGRNRRAFADDEIVRRAVAAMASEAAFVIAEGVAASPSDIDLVLTNGYGFPRHEGGPVFWARQQPRDELVAAFRELAETGGPGFRLGPVEALLT
ncbi:3-hydroxyacyl-CoA dehydrogenase NAD-binding domain-containing protein [Paracoccus sp. P2]|uniref:3-hydroxyacyl-CoA dehydrogenase NAD-binding domain-containing protein n=1 Tax=Paracoccus sp. P2 TaxID=3248840 RepID=UPI00391EF10E